MSPPALDLGSEPGPYAWLLWLLLLLFVLRVLGQIIVALRHPRWLPPMREWYSGLLPYPVLLPIQILFIAVMTWLALRLSDPATAPAPRSSLGTGLIWFSFVYAAAMVIRLIVWIRRPPERRRAFIPIIFHMVLAAFLFVLGSWHVRQEGAAQPRLQSPRISGCLPNVTTAKRSRMAADPPIAQVAPAALATAPASSDPSGERPTKTKV